jgi:hypothetical protein
MEIYMECRVFFDLTTGKMNTPNFRFFGKYHLLAWQRMEKAQSIVSNSKNEKYELQLVTFLDD